MRCFCGAMAEPKASLCFRCAKEIQDTIDGYDERSYEDEAAMMKPGYLGYMDLTYPPHRDQSEPPFEPDLPRANGGGSSGTTPVTLPTLSFMKDLTDKELLAIAEDEVEVS